MIPLRSDSPEWYCVRSQTKREHIAAGHLRELEGVEVFSPRLRYRKATRRGKSWWVEAMFPGYIMAKFNLAEMERAVTYCAGVRGLLRFGSQIPSVPENFVNALKLEINTKNQGEENLSDIITLHPIIEVGDEVEIAHGPLQGSHGTVIAVPSSSERVKILIEFMGGCQPIDVDIFSLLLPRSQMVKSS
jgi:transcriptional antiterminator RfaH